MTVSDVYMDWHKDLAEYGIADYLRCVAMSCQELRLPRSAYLAEAVKRGFNKSTAGTCWAYVGRQ